MPAGSSRKRERQYEHLKESAEKRGASEGRAKEISARAVNKERARSGEAKTASTTSTRDPKSASQRGGERSDLRGSDRELHLPHRLRQEQAHVRAREVIFVPPPLRLWTMSAAGLSGRQRSADGHGSRRSRC
ncbi:hypothetical protein [Streptomyces sp. NPDC005131]